MNKKKKNPKNLLIAGAVAVSTPMVEGQETSGKTAHEQDGQKIQAASPPPWSYSGSTGPCCWGSLCSDFEIAKTGKAQSPIDLTHNHNCAEAPPFELQYKNVPLRVLNTGHTIQVNCEDAGGIVTSDQTYKIIQVHFHSPSEHTVDTEQFPLEAHFVHRNEQGHAAVLGTFCNIGEPNETFEQILSAALPDHGIVNSPEGKSFNPLGLLPESMSRWEYEGSLTTPPCTEGVAWSLFVKPVSLSESQIRRFNAFYLGNNRPIQNLNDRVVKQYS